MRFSVGYIPSSLGILLGLMRGMIRGMQSTSAVKPGASHPGGGQVVARQIAMRFNETNWVWRVCNSRDHLGCVDWRGGGVLADLRMNEFFLPGFNVTSKTGNIGVLIKLDDFMSVIAMAEDNHANAVDMILLRSRFDLQQKEFKFVVKSKCGTTETYIPVTLLSSEDAKKITVPSEIPANNTALELDFALMKRTAERLSASGLGITSLHLSLTDTKELQGIRTMQSDPTQMSSAVPNVEDPQAVVMSIKAEAADFHTEVMIPASLNTRTTTTPDILGTWSSQALHKTITAANCIPSDTCILIICPKQYMIFYLYLPDDMRSHAVCYIDAQAEE